MTTPMPAGVADAIRAATWRYHDAAEGSPFLEALTSGRLGREAYVDLLAQQWVVYAALEQAAVTWVDDPVVGGLVDARLDRRAALEADLVHLAGDVWRDCVQIAAATSAYRDRIEQVAPTWAGGFVAHHYTRYLGDLSGGRAIGARVRRHLDLDQCGAAFYDFSHIPSPTAFKDGYRARLDATGWQGDELDGVIAEVERAYRLNTNLLDELAARHAVLAPEGADG